MDKKDSNTLQAFWIALGSLFSFGFGIVSSMILSRYFLKEDYGTYKQVIYVYNTLLTIFTLGLPKAYSYFLPREKNEKAKSLISKITNLFFLLGGVFSILLFLFSGEIASFLKNPDLAYALKIFSPVPLLMLPTMGLEGILSTYRMTKFMAVYTICTRLVMLICVATPVIFFDGTYIEAVIGFVIASLVSFVLALYFKYLPVKDQKKMKTDINYQEIFKFSLPLLTASLWGTLLKSTDQFFISRYFGTEVFAEFSNGFMDLPFIGMIVGSTATVLSPIFSKMNHENINPIREIYPLWINVFRKSAMLIYPLLIYTIIFADVIMMFLYGDKYEKSGIYYQIYNMSNFFKVIVYAPLIINIGKVKFYQNVYMYSAILLIPLELLSIYIVNSPYAIAIISIFLRIARSIVFLLFISNYFKMKFHHLFPINTILKISSFSIIFLLSSRYILLNILEIDSDLLILFASFPLYIIVYGFYSYIVNLNYHSIIKPLVSKLPFFNKVKKLYNFKDE